MEHEYVQKLRSMSQNDLKILVETILNYKFEKIKGERKIDKIEHIIALFKDNKKFQDFFELLSKLDDVSINKACRYLNEIYGVPADELRGIKKKGDLLFALYKHNLINEIDSLSFVSGIDKFRDRWRFTLNVKPKKEIKTSLSLIEFCREWNRNNLDLLFAELVPTKEDFLLIRILKEVGRRAPKQFKFRTEGRLPKEISSEEFRTEVIEHYPISFNHIYVRKVADTDLFELIFNFDPQKEEKMVENLLSSIFGLEVKLDQLVYSKPDVVKTIEDVSKQLFSEVKKKGFDKIRSEFNKMKSAAIEKVENLDLPSDKKEKLKEIIGHTHPLPPKIVNDVERGIITLEQIVDPEIFLKQPEGKQILDMASRIADDVEEEKKTYLYVINRKPFLILPDGMIKASRRLGELDMQALKLIFGC
jgi:hypothetical protein